MIYPKYIVFAVLIFAFLLNACSGGEQSETSSAGEYYTCPMHPTVRSNKPGVCPVCNMTLVKASAVAQDTAANTIQIVETQQALANIKTDTVRYGMINNDLNVLGITSVNRNAQNVISARSRGRIDKLLKRNPGDLVSKGELLYVLYSEELSAAENEYLNALNHRDKYPDNDKTIASMLNSAKTRLKLAGISDDQITKLEKSRVVSGAISFYSDVQGTITEIPVKEGQYVETGTIILSVADLSTLWVDAQFYGNERALPPNSSAEVEYNGKKYNATLDLISPSLEANSKINLVKFRVPNDKMELKPGLMVSVKLKGEEQRALLIPRTALLMGKMPLVWVKSRPELFESRMVKIGMETKQQAEILEGLRPGELVVSSGAYLVNSEFILKKGAAAQHKHAH